MKKMNATIVRCSRGYRIVDCDDVFFVYWPGNDIVESIFCYFLIRCEHFWGYEQWPASSYFRHYLLNTRVVRKFFPKLKRCIVR